MGYCLFNETLCRLDNVCLHLHPLKTLARRRVCGAFGASGLHFSFESRLMETVPGWLRDLPSEFPQYAPQFVCPAGLQRRGPTHTLCRRSSPRPIPWSAHQTGGFLSSCHGSRLRPAFCSQTADPVNPETESNYTCADATAEWNSSLELGLHRSYVVMLPEHLQAPVYYPGLPLRLRGTQVLGLMQKVFNL